MRVLGIDPGLSTTGFGIIAKVGHKVRVVCYGTIRPPSKLSLPKRLQYLYNEVTKLMETYDPHVLAIEDSFYSKNVKSAVALGQARGSILLAGANKDIPCVQFAPRKIKQSVVGNGAATKEQVQFMVKNILNLKELPKTLDSSDALAVGLCYLNQPKWG
ncbi:MAG: crossover junction endodeoxyribonuclease RuvC [FCB group bacterium]|nr:crossover junction endodeoxyribonuclease RuvC [FCB group bacterium]